MTKEEMQKILDEMPAGANVEDYIKKKNEVVVDTEVIKEEYGHFMNLMRDAHRRYMKDVKKKILILMLVTTGKKLIHN